MDDIFFLFHDRNEISLYKLHSEKYENNNVIGYLTPIINFHPTKLTNFDPRFFFPVLFFLNFFFFFYFFFLTFESLTFADREIEREVEQFQKFHSPAGEDDLNTYEKILITFYDETVLRTPF